MEPLLHPSHWQSGPLFGVQCDHMHTEDLKLKEPGLPKQAHRVSVSSGHQQG